MLLCNINGNIFLDRRGIFSLPLECDQRSVMTERNLVKLYRKAHNYMRSVDGLQPQEALDELMKYLFFKQTYEDQYNNMNNLSATDIKQSFRKFLKESDFFSGILWRDYKIHLSNQCLEKVHNLFFYIKFKQINFDIRSSALAEFITPDIRRGLGIFLTPSPVVQMIVNYLNPNPKLKILDPACGSGTFLIEILKYFRIKNNNRKSALLHIFGFEKNPKMLLLSKLNLSHIKNVVFNDQLMDTIKCTKNDIFDLIVTNPPFGVHLDSRHYNFSLYKTCQDDFGYSLKTQTSEIVFMEKCLQLLKPNGMLAIVVPRSIITNNNLQKARIILSAYGYIEAIINMPPETFTFSGTQTATSILFIRKYSNKKQLSEFTNVIIGNVSNTGYDSTGRAKTGEQLSSLPSLMKECLKFKKSKGNISIKTNIKKRETFEKVSLFFSHYKSSGAKGKQLISLCHNICTGKTPSRNAYSNTGAFILKVGNLTGSGINWSARDRNHISMKEIENRVKSKKVLIVKKYDILLTAAAHNLSYIAKKSDMFINAPTFINSHITFVGEMILIRPNIKKINPFLLLAFLKHPVTIKKIQEMVRGQTAHLYSDDLGKLIIPDQILKNKNMYQDIINLTERELTISNTLNSISFKRGQLLNNLTL